MHFGLIDPLFETQTARVKRGDAFDRVILRLLLMPTVKTIEYRQCITNPNIPNNRVDLTARPVEVWVYGPTMCAIAD